MQYKYCGGFIEDSYRIRVYFSNPQRELIIKAYKYPGNKKAAEVRFPIKEEPKWSVPCQCFVDLSDHDETTLDILTERLLETLKARD